VAPLVVAALEVSNDFGVVKKSAGDIAASAQNEFAPFGDGLNDQDVKERRCMASSGHARTIAVNYTNVHYIVKRTTIDCGSCRGDLLRVVVGGQWTYDKETRAKTPTMPTLHRGRSIWWARMIEGMETAPRHFQLSLRTILEVVALIAVVLALMYQRGGTAGRYQMLSSPSHGSRTDVFMYDTATGRVWQQEYDGTWTPATLPGLSK
jgi:hypothetical protein